VSVVFGIAISLVHYLSLDKLQSNERMIRNRSISKAFNLSIQSPTGEAYENAITTNIEKQELKTTTGAIQLYISKTQPREIGFVFTGMGFWDRISGILVLSDDLSEIRSIEILDQKETPGLGARIEEDWFKEQFKSIPIDWSKPAASRIVFGQKTANGKIINGITGASQTSSALQRILNSELERFMQAYKQQSPQ
jgi:Na+-transporting NADH:ubiquinone oxidoreductase subunit C